MTSEIFIDTSAFIALFIRDDEFHKRAIKYWQKTKERDQEFLTSNFVLDELYTFLRARKGKKTAIDFANYLAENTDIVEVKRIFLQDEKRAWQYFKKLLGRGVSFTDCTSFALMKRLLIKKAFAFDEDFEKAGFKVIP